jgi:UDP-glucose 4-epimerase
LISEGHSVTILDDFSTGNKENLKTLEGIEAVNLVQGSVLESQLVDKHVRSVDRVFHLAAAVGVLNIIQSPLSGLRINLNGTENVLSACLKYGKPFLLTSSSEIYGKNTSAKLNEDSDRIIGSPSISRWSYSDSKAIDEHLAISTSREFGLETRIVRLFNTVGPRQVGKYGMVIPRFVEAALLGKPLIVYGDGTQRRSFGHVRDIVQGIYMVEQSELTIAQPINIGNETEISILELAKEIISFTNSTSVVEFHHHKDVMGQSFEDMDRRFPDTTLIKKLTGWTASLDIEEIIRDVSNYMRSLIGSR